MGNTDDEDRLSSLHSQLSNADRRRMIEELQTQNLKLSEVARKLDITPTEAFRQLQRLTEAGLLEKTPEGRFRSTSYSKLILESSTAMGFLSQHREFFLEHDASLIPPQFRARFGELSKTALFTEAAININSATAVLANAEKKVDIMTEQGLDYHSQMLKERSLDGVKVRFLVQESTIEYMKKDPKKAKQAGDMRFIPRICAMIILTDKSVGIALPKLDGKMDYQVLAGTDPASMKWAEDLFEQQWNIGRPWHP